MQRRRLGCALVAALLASASAASAQTFPAEDPVLQRLWEEGMENSHAYELAQVLLDSIGPRLNGSPGHRAANEWAVNLFESWGIEARNEQNGTWMSWEREITHIDLVEPRVRTLEGMMLAWSPGTRGKVKAGVVILADVADSAAFEAWLPAVKGKFVLISYGEPTCRTDADWEEHATEESFARLEAERALRYAGLPRRRGKRAHAPRATRAAGQLGDRRTGNLARVRGAAEELGGVPQPIGP